MNSQNYSKPQNSKNKDEFNSKHYTDDIMIQFYILVNERKSADYTLELNQLSL